MIPPGTAVRDAHACYEVVVPVTVPDKPRLAPCCLLLPSFHNLYQVLGHGFPVSYLVATHPAGGSCGYTDDTHAIRAYGVARHLDSDCADPVPTALVSA